MIVVDIETSGLDFNKCGIWQIGAIDLDSMKEFLEEAGIDAKDSFQDGAGKVSGKSEKEMRNEGKQSQKEMLEHFLKWLEDKKIKNFICENPQFDWAFVVTKAKKYGFTINFHHRCFDLHSIASLRYFDINKSFLIKENHSDMSLPNCLKFCGIEDTRRKIEDNEILKEGKPHNALEDCKLEAECFSRLVYGKNLIPEYARFKILGYLLKK